ncbi:chemotaxis protein CheW [Enterovibrio sp. ZSDZ35]|uniref:Chemotaxis protein CheW n=1 Tax=Enterovibrio qingdaonensis TaxID=2899818 RepID=A0ABT5QQJ5_9GAMM|nr:chemotaxis protein CheW [Enterovibrio sp. ZSDZ35]MDD1783247.1 chemotaxis protein CheW [Enterovibrio sp. ZSDZ35]
MKDSRALSSVQALDDYFDALLDEDDQPQLADTDAEPILTDAAIEAVPKLQAVTSEPADKFNGAILTKEQRDLSSVEKLLSQLQLDEDMEVEVVETTETDIELLTDTDVSIDVQTEQQTHVETALEQDVDVVTDVLDAVETELAVETEERISEPHVVEAVATETVEAEAISVEEAVSVEEENIVDEAIEIDTDAEVETEAEVEEETAYAWKNIVPEHGFQVLFFESFGVTYAVPLAELGGIHRLEECNHLIGRPDWYLGLQTERDQQLDIVDTAKWVMPEKITDNSHRDGYSYIVLLGDSKWGLACNALLGTESLNGEQVRWREQAGKRPWLAGLVKQKMCALIHVEALITMLNQGIDANALA